MGSGYSKMKKQQKMMEDQYTKMQEEMATAEYSGSAGNGLVTVVLTGDKNIKSIQIKPECVDPEDVEGLEDLIFAALKNASDNLETNSPINQMSPTNLFG